MGLFDRIMGRNLPERRDARELYFAVLRQSRDPAFFGMGRMPDDYDGRIDLITLHIAVLLYRFRSGGTDGKLLGQALFDEMKDDFEIALREEGIADTGVKRRIKPMIGHFYDRLKIYTDALENDDVSGRIALALCERTDADVPGVFENAVGHYVATFRKVLDALTFKQIAKARFSFPALEKV